MHIAMFQRFEFEPCVKKFGFINLVLEWRFVSFFEYSYSYNIYNHSKSFLFSNYF